MLAKLWRWLRDANSALSIGERAWLYIGTTVMTIGGTIAAWIIQQPPITQLTIALTLLVTSYIGITYAYDRRHKKIAAGPRREDSADSTHAQKPESAQKIGREQKQPQQAPSFDVRLADLGQDPFIRGDYNCICALWVRNIGSRSLSGCTARIESITRKQAEMPPQLVLKRFSLPAGSMEYVPVLFKHRAPERNVWSFFDEPGKKEYPILANPLNLVIGIYGGDVGKQVRLKIKRGANWSADAQIIEATEKPASPEKEVERDTYLVDAIYRVAFSRWRDYTFSEEIDVEKIEVAILLVMQAAYDGKLPIWGHRIFKGQGLHTPIPGHFWQDNTVDVYDVILERCDARDDEHRKYALTMGSAGEDFYGDLMTSKSEIDKLWPLENI